MHKGRVVVVFSIWAAGLLKHLPPAFTAQTLRRLMNAKPSADYAEVLRLRGEICHRSLACASPAGCLQRSIAISVACALFGKSVDWVAGFMNPPFRAHAWVEVKGHPVGEQDEISGFIPVHSVRPREPVSGPAGTPSRSQKRGPLP